MSDAYYVFECPREKLEPYIALIFSKWLRSLKYGNDYFRLMDDKPYYAFYHRYIETVLGRGNTVVRLAVLASDPDIAFGFCVHSEAVLHYVHVHKDYRRLGIGSALLPAQVSTITHVTANGLSIWASKFPKWKFNPFA